jgi:hypothetical protein
MSKEVVYDKRDTNSVVGSTVTLYPPYTYTLLCEIFLPIFVKNIDNYPNIP